MTYFEPHEFKMGNEIVFDQMKPHFLEKLNLARSYSSIRWILTSSYRTVEYSKAKGWSVTSSHIKGLAVDISVPNSKARYEILACLLKAGFNRIGIGSDFIHVDLDEEKPGQVIWTYYD